MSEVQHSISIDHSSSNRVVDVFLDQLDVLKKFHAVECSLSIYPTAKNITADDFEVTPYEDYVRELSVGRRSTYTAIRRSSDKVFGMAVGLCIAVVFCTSALRTATVRSGVQSVQHL
jgi:hypothetical protein